MRPFPLGTARPFVTPLYAVVFGLTGFAALGRPRTTRQGRGLAIGVAFRGAGAADRRLRRLSPDRRTCLRAVWLVYGVPLLGFSAAWRSIFQGTAIGRFLRNAAPNICPALAPGAPMIGTTLGRYLSLRFARMILGVFATIFVLIYILDFVEMLRRTGDLPGVDAVLRRLSLLSRMPALAEQILPFAMLGGSMFAFLSSDPAARTRRGPRRRRLGLAIPGAAAAHRARASALFSSRSTIRRRRLSNNVPMRSRPRSSASTGSSNTDTGMWIRQKSIDGQAIIRAEKSSDPAPSSPR